jgi:intracellular multiplication protein IcmE
MSNEADDLYGDDAVPVQQPTNGTQAQPTKMENISAVAKGSKTGKIMMVTGGAVVIVIALLFVAFSSKKKTVVLPPSVSGVDVGQTPTLRDQGNKDLVDSKQYQTMVDQVNQGRAADATKNGTSVQPLADGTARTLQDFKTPAEVERDAKVKAEQDAAAAAQAAAQAAQAARQAQLQPGGPQAQGVNQDPNYAVMLQNAQAGMSEMLAPRARGMQSFDVSVMPKVVVASTTATQAGAVPAASMQQAGGAAVATATPAAASKTLISAGVVGAARMDTGVNTDIAGQFVATLVTGPYAGAKLIGTSTRVGEAASLQFTTMSLVGQGISMPISAVALDAETLEAGNATDVDRKLFVKYGVKPLVSGIAAVGQALLQAGTTVAVDGQTIVTTKPQITRTQAEQIVAGNAAQQLNTDTSALNTTPTVRVAPGTVVGVMFIKDVIYTPGSK